MQIDIQRKAIDQALSNTLQSKNADSVAFKWYLALHVNDITQYNAENAVHEYDELTYHSINQSSAPKPSLYSQAKHFTQYQHQTQSLQLCDHPNLFIQLSNCMQPHSLHWSKNEQLLPSDVIQNCPLHTQNKLSEHDKRSQSADTVYESHASVDSAWEHRFEKSGSCSKEAPNNNVQFESETPATNEFVDTTLANIDESVKISF